uniref:Uncharacterized protein n=1 Tax=Anguilla anguilla TaxID=7936 RepID=A0A0E9X6G4_ANGAN
MGLGCKYSQEAMLPPCTQTHSQQSKTTKKTFWFYFHYIPKYSFITANRIFICLFSKEYTGN